MIAHLKGTIHSKSTNQVVVEVNGVGYQIFVSLNTFYELPPEGFEIFLYIYSHIREDQFTLFGFLNIDEKNLFQQLLKVTGIGPKLALTLLSGLSAHEIGTAIANGDVMKLKAIPGIGQKTAEQIIWILKGKIIPGAPTPKRKNAMKP